jgi:hypothetical protein
MLDNSERKQIKRLLKDRFTNEELERLVNAAGEDFDAVVRQNANKLDAIMDILDHAERNGWTMDLLKALVEVFEERLKPPEKEVEIAKVRDVENRLKKRWGRGTALQDPFKSCFVRGGWPFVNRPPISDAFARLAQPAGFRIAVVNGPSGSGKTYSKELPQFVAEIQGNQLFKVYYRDVSEGEYSITAEKLVQSILLAWNLDLPIPSQLSQSSSYAAELSEWLAAKVPRGETWWVIVDGLAKITPDPGLLHFLMALARHIADSPHALRLVLLDLGDQNLLPLSAESMATKVKIDEITISDLVEYYFKVLHLAQAASNQFDPTMMSIKAKSVLDQALAQSSNGQRLARLKEVLLQATEELGLG